MKQSAPLLATLMICGSPVLAAEYDYGTRPDWSRFKALGEAAVRAKLPATTQWAFEWPNGYMKGGWRHKGRFVGYLSCGIVRASEPVKGFHMLTQFVVVIRDEQVQIADISDRYSNSLVNIMCADLVDRGLLPPARLVEQSEDARITTLGLTIRAMPEGAYVLTVATGSPGDKAKLAPGMVITQANGISLAGMGPAMTADLSSTAPSLALETAAGERHVIVK